MVTTRQAARLFNPAGVGSLRRRQFLGTAALLTAAASLIQIPSIARASVDPEALADRLLAVHPDRRSASIIGGVFLKERPARPRLDHVVLDLMRNLDMSANGLFKTSPLDLRIALKKRTSEDFRLGRTRHVRGWVLGETEVWLCGLAALRTG